MQDARKLAAFSPLLLAVACGGAPSGSSGSSGPSGSFVGTWVATEATAALAGAQTCVSPGVVATFTSGTLLVEGGGLTAATQGYATVNGVQCAFGQSFTFARE